MDVELNRSSAVPLYTQIEQQLRAAIEDSTFKPHDVIPSEHALCVQYGVSRMTARRAIDQLVDEGLLFRQPGKGTFVAPAKISHALSTLLSFSAGMQEQGLSQRTVVAHASLGESPIQVARGLGLPARSKVVHLARIRIVEEEAVAYHEAYLPPYFSPILAMDLTGSLTKMMSELGGSVRESRDTVQSIAASHEAAEALGLAVGAPVLRVEGVAYSSTGEPLRYTDAVYRGERFRLTVTSSSRSDSALEITDAVR